MLCTLQCGSATCSQRPPKSLSTLKIQETKSKRQNLKLRLPLKNMIGMHDAHIIPKAPKNQTKCSKTKCRSPPDDACLKPAPNDFFISNACTRINNNK
jgi:hypothetical protein